jgi:ATP-dependent DNA helicase RecQ
MGGLRAIDDWAEAIAEAERRIAGIEADEQARWRWRSIRRCLTAMADSESRADQGVLLRELLRLNNQPMTLHADLLGRPSNPMSAFRRHGLHVTTVDGDSDRWLVRVNFQLPESLDIEGLEQALQLDPVLRRPWPSACPDGSFLRLTNHPSYRNPSQKAAVRALLTMPAGGTLMVSIPTGGGKSLMFQIGTRWWRETAPDGQIPFSVVIVPTTALALDHVRSLRQVPGLECSAAITHGTGTAERKAIIDGAFQGTVPIVIMSPEAALNTAQKDLLEAAQSPSDRPYPTPGRLAGVFVDEAHIISTWGRSFRPEFQRLHNLVADLRTLNPELRTVLLSATLNRETVDYLEPVYAGQGPYLAISAKAPRLEFDLVVHHASNPVEREAMVLDLADVLPRPALIYTTKREDAEALFRKLQERDYQRIALFTGDTEGAERDAIVNRWGEDRLDLVVATSAFGMGVDKPDVRAVVHACVPEDASRYYQEIGRAARDGHQSAAICLWTDEDAEVARGMERSQLIGPERAAVRWASMLRLSERQRVERDGVYHTLIPVDLNAYPDPTATYTTERNRRWNMSLLVQLQRSSAIVIESRDSTWDMWPVQILNLELLSITASDQSRMEALMHVRESEVASARERLRRFQGILRGNSQRCMLDALFREVESGAGIGVICGHCPVCRQDEEIGTIGQRAAVRFSGLDQVWPSESPQTPSPFGIGIREVNPDGLVSRSVDCLIEPLAAAGIVQFVVPHMLADEVALRLSARKGEAGFVLDGASVLDQGWQMAALPTAVFLDSDSDGLEAVRVLAKRLRENGEMWESHPLIVVMPADLRLKDRDLARLSQTAPYDERYVLEKSKGDRR